MSGITFKYSGDAPALAKAVIYATAIFKSDKFRDIIETRTERFFNTQRSNASIAKAIFECNAEIKISMFSKRPIRFIRSLTTAYVDGQFKNTIFFNAYAISRGAEANTNTLVHETVHVVDKFHDENNIDDFTHKGQKPHRPPENQSSAPYWIGNRAQELLPLIIEQDDTINFDLLEKSKILSVLTENSFASNDRCGYCS